MSSIVRHLLVCSLLALLSLLLSPALVFAQSEAPRRLALVIGNSEYDNVYRLPNAAPDAKKIADALKLADFEVVLLRDADLQQMNDAIDDIAARTGKGTQTVLFYFAGHGFQLGGANYLVPRDAELDRRDLIDERTLRLDSALKRLASPERQTLVLLDACRDNPLPQSVRGTETGNGLAEVGNSLNTYVVFATAPGQVTFDGGGESSPFTKAFVKHVLTPDQSLPETIMEVRDDVAEATFERQVVWESGALRQRFSFIDGMAEQEVLFGPDPAVAEDPMEVDVAEVPDIVEFGRRDDADKTVIGEQVVPEAPDIPATPDAPATPDVPDVPEIPATPDLSDVPDIPATPDIPVKPDLPATPEVVKGPVFVEPGKGWKEGTVVDPDLTPPGDATDMVPEGEPDAPNVPGAPVTPEVPDESLPANDGEKLIDLGKEDETIEVADLPDGVIPDLPSEPVQLDQKELYLAVQTELQRVGCYTSTLDGDWGNGSRKALSNYAKEKKLASIGDFATLEVLARLKAETSTVCKAVVVVKKEPKPDKPVDKTVKVDKPIKVAKPAEVKPVETPAKGGDANFQGIIRFTP